MVYAFLILLTFFSKPNESLKKTVADYLKDNLGGSTNPDDSIMLIAYDKDPVYIYENSGIRTAPTMSG